MGISKLLGQNAGGNPQWTSMLSWGESINLVASLLINPEDVGHFDLNAKNQQQQQDIQPVSVHLGYFGK